MTLKIGLMSVVMSVACAASAQAKDSGLELGARLGLGLPLGDIAGSEDEDEITKLGDFVSNKVPLQLDVGYRISPQLMIGGYFQYALATVKLKFEDESICDLPGMSCSASVIRLGAQAIYHFTPITEGSAGWIGGGIGYEWLTLGFENKDNDEFSLTVKGFEFINAQGGYDFAVGEKFRVGPYLLVSAARYDSGSATTSEDGVEEESELGDIEDKAVHGWFTFGVKATFGAL